MLWSEIYSILYIYKYCIIYTLLLMLNFLRKIDNYFLCAIISFCISLLASKNPFKTEK